MARKTNYNMNGYDYYRVSATIKGKREFFYGSGKTEAEAKRDAAIKAAKEQAEREEQPQKTEQEKRAEQTVKEGMHFWMFEVRRVDSDLKATSFELYEGVYRLHIPNEIFGMVIGKAQRIEIQRVFNHAYESGKKTSAQLFSARKLLVSFFNYCIGEEIIDRNPCGRIVVPGMKKVNKARKKAKKEKIEVFINEEIEKIVKASEGNRLRFAVLLDIATGMRLGELLATKELKNPKNATLEIKNNLVNVNVFDQDGNKTKQIIEQTTKSESGERSIPIPQNLIGEYKKHMVMLKEDRLHAGSAWNPDWDKEKYIFVTSTGRPYEKSNFRRHWRRLLSSAGVEYKRPHCMRHTYITKLIQNGTDLATVMELAGHSSIEQTLQYTHIEFSSKVKAVETLNEWFK